MILSMLSVVLLTCTEAYELKTKNFESLLVVEATITDELRPQEIKLSKTSRLESDEPNLVSNAEVYIETDLGEQYNFVNVGEGLYVSVNAFQAQPNRSYILNVTLSDGSKYISTPEVLPPASNLESLNPILQTVSGEQVIVVSASSSSDTAGAIYFKYEYEETYKIEAPYYSPLDLILVDNGNVDLIQKPENVRFCYSSNTSTDIIQISLSDSKTPFVQDFPIRFINIDNSILRNRYSILVKQYVQSLEAYNFYKILKELGTIENLFTDNQPGFIQGNISSVENIEENVIGFFQVSSFSSKRIYFDYGDFDIQLPPYFYECNLLVGLNWEDGTEMDGDPNDQQIIFNELDRGGSKYVSGQYPIYTLVSARCGDCSLFSSTSVPDFWED